MLLCPLSRCCNAGMRAAAKSLETIQRQRSSGHRRRPSRKPQRKSAGTPLHSACSIIHARMGNGRSRAQPLRSWGIERGLFFRQEQPPFTTLPKATSNRHRRSDEDPTGGLSLVCGVPRRGQSSPCPHDGVVGETESGVSLQRWYPPNQVHADQPDLPSGTAPCLRAEKQVPR